MTRRKVDAVSSITRPLKPFREGLRAVVTSKNAPVKSALESLEWSISFDIVRVGVDVDVDAEEAFSSGWGGRFSRLDR